MRRSLRESPSHPLSSVSAGSQTWWSSTLQCPPEEGWPEPIDDGYVAGPPALVFPAIRKFEEDIYNKCVLTLQRTKCKVFSWTGEMPNNVIPGFTLAGTEVDGRFEPGFICVGAPIGTDSYVKNMMRKKVSELRVKVTKTVDKLEYWLAQSGGGGS